MDNKVGVIMPPLNEIKGETEPYDNNGSAPSSHAQVSDINKETSPGISHYLDGNGGVVVPPLNELKGTTEPYDPNGSAPSSHAQLAQTESADINPAGFSKEIVGMIASATADLPKVRSEVPDLINGSHPSAFSPAGY